MEGKNRHRTESGEKKDSFNEEKFQNPNNSDERDERIKKEGLSFEDFLYYINIENSEQLSEGYPNNLKRKFRTYRLLLSDVISLDVVSEIEKYVRENENDEVKENILKIISIWEERIRKSNNPESILPKHFKGLYPLVFEKINEPRKVLKFLQIENFFDSTRWDGDILKIMNFKSFAKTLELILIRHKHSDYIEFNSSSYRVDCIDWVSFLSGSVMKSKDELEEVKELFFSDLVSSGYRKDKDKERVYFFDWRIKDGQN